jgi:hypothetical protein
MIEQELYATMPAPHYPQHQHQHQHFAPKKMESKRDEVMPLLSAREQSFKSKIVLVRRIYTQLSLSPNKHLINILILQSLCISVTEKLMYV